MEYKRLKELDFEIDTRVYAIFMATNVDVRPQKNNQQFIALTMVDKDIKLEAKKFGATADEIALMKNGGVYAAAIDVKMYNGSKSYTLYNFDTYNEDPSSFIEWADGMQDSVNYINEKLAYLNNTIYKDIVAKLIIDNWSRFSVWTAASSMHHDIMGGLLVHTAEVTKQSEIIADYWISKYGESFINKPLLISAAMLHDLGKIYELDVDESSGTTQYATIAALETHITICISLIERRAYEIKFGMQLDDNSKMVEQLDAEKEALQLLKHCILAHHGKLEYGSPITPNIPEAIIINIADNISSEMFRINKELKQMDPKTSKAVWAAGKMFNTYKKSN